MVNGDDNLLEIFKNSFLIQNTNGFIDWGLPCPQRTNVWEGPVHLTNGKSEDAFWHVIAEFLGLIRPA